MISEDDKNRSYLFLRPGVLLVKNLVIRDTSNEKKMKRKREKQNHREWKGPATPGQFETTTATATTTTKRDEGDDDVVVMWDLASLHDDGSDTFTLTPNPESSLRIGSDGGISDMHVKNRYASRSHAEIVSGSDGTHDIVDVGSTNGTFVGGTRLTPHVPRRLREGDVIEFGSADEDQVGSRYEYRRSSETDPVAVTEKNFRDAFKRSYADGVLVDRGIFCLY